MYAKYTFYKTLIIFASNDSNILYFSLSERYKDGELNILNIEKYDIIDHELFVYEYYYWIFAFYKNYVLYSFLNKFATNNSIFLYFNLLESSKDDECNDTKFKKIGAIDHVLLTFKHRCGILHFLEF